MDGEERRNMYAYGGGADRMRWFSPFAGVSASGDKSICKHLCMNHEGTEKFNNHVNERNKNQWQEE